MEVWEEKDKKGNIKWDGKVVSMFEAMQRLREGKPVYEREFGPGKEFVFSLAPGEIICLKKGDAKTKIGLYRVRDISYLRQKEKSKEYLYVHIGFVHINDARKKKEIQRSNDWESALLEPLRKMECEKVQVFPLGDVRRAND
jgi:hydrogenase maturation factor